MEHSSEPTTPLWLPAVIIAVTIAGCRPGAPVAEAKPTPTQAPAVALKTEEPTPPLPPPAATATQLPQPPPTPTPPQPQEPFIVLHKIITAGDYYALRISGSGQAEYTNYSYLYQITDRRQGDLGPQRVADLFAQVTDAGFFDLAGEYQLPPPEEDAPELEYEHVYYWVQVFDGQREETVLAHEYARPPELTEISQALLDAALQLPDAHTAGPEKGVFLLALDHRLLPYLAREESMPHLELSEQSVEAYAPLEQALRNPGSLVQVESPTESEVVQLFSPEFQMTEVMFNDKRFVVLLITG